MSEIPNVAYTTDIQVRWADTDQAKHVNHAKFITYLESTRIDWINKMANDTGFIKIPIIIARVEIDYLAPIMLFDEIKVSMWVSRIGTKSFEYSYVIHGKDDGDNQKIYASAKTTQVFFDYNSQRSIVIPELERKKLEDLMPN